jgi:hypothetical protein
MVIMITRSYLARSIVPAIAAVLVLGSTPLLAQDPAAQPMGRSGAAPAPAPLPTPRLQMPVAPAPAPAPAPQIAPQGGNAAPATSTSNRVFNSQPVVQSVPAEMPPPSGTDAATNAESSAASASAAPVNRATPAARTTVASPPPAEPGIPEQVPEQAPPGDIPPPLPPIPPVIDGGLDLVPNAETASQGTGAEMAVWLGLLTSALGVLGLGFLGALALRRRQVRRVDRVPMIDRPKVEAGKTSPATVSPVVTRDLGSKPATSVPAGVVTTASLAAKPREATPEATAPRSQQPVSPIREFSREASLAPAGASVPLPRKVPENDAERRALIDRMVAAKPDRANPFHTPRARRRRARLILQSLGRRFENGKSRIDLSQYPQNWSELQGNSSAAA